MHIIYQPSVRKWDLGFIAHFLINFRRFGILGTSG